MVDYSNLNKDIEMDYNEERNKWDWTINNEDLSLVKNAHSLYYGIVNKLLTGYHEMASNPSFNGYGNKTYDLLKSNTNTLTKNQVRDYTYNQLDNMNRISTINYLNVETDIYGYNVSFKVTMKTGDTVSGEVNISDKGDVINE